MSKRFLINIDLSQNQLLNAAIQNLSAAPSTPVPGQIYFNTVDARIYFWDGIAWIDISGDLRSVIGGNGLTSTYTPDGDEVTLDVNVDNVTIEISSDSLRIKDLGVSTGKLSDGAVTTVKIDNNAVTLGKLQQIAAMKLIANVTGSAANAQEVDILTNIETGATNANLATSLAIKTYIDGTVANIGNLEGGWDASSGTFPVGSSPVSGTKKGDYWYVTVAGTTGGVAFNVGDVIIAKIDNASTTLATDWIQLEVNRDQATETTLGLVQIATQSDTNTGTNDTAAVTPFKLSGRTATETRTGIAEIATQSETDDGVDDSRIVTPLKLKTFLDTRTGGFAANIGNGSATSYVINHSLNTIDVIVMIKDNSTLEEVIADVVITDANNITVSFATAPANNAYRVIIKK